MKRFHFRLEKLLEVREYKEKIAKFELAEKTGKCTVIEIELKKNAKKLDLAIRDRFKKGRTLNDYFISELYVKRITQESERLLSDLAKAEMEKEKARQTYLEKSRDKEVLEKLMEKRQKEYYMKANRTETVFLDEIAQNTNYLRNVNYESEYINLSMGIPE